MDLLLAKHLEDSKLGLTPAESFTATRRKCSQREAPALLAWMHEEKENKRTVGLPSHPVGCLATKEMLFSPSVTHQPLHSLCITLGHSWETKPGWQSIMAGAVEGRN